MIKKTFLGTLAVFITLILTFLIMIVDLLDSLFDCVEGQWVHLKEIKHRFTCIYEDLMK